MASNLDKFIEQVQRQGIAVTLVVASSAVGYYIMDHHNKEQVQLFKSYAAELREDKKILYKEVIDCLKK
jgi:ribosomal protein S12 methylthiotransferase accessory factor YcaO